MCSLAPKTAPRLEHPYFEVKRKGQELRHKIRLDKMRPSGIYQVPGRGTAQGDQSVLQPFLGDRDMVKGT